MKKKFEYSLANIYLIAYALFIILLSFLMVYIEPSNFKNFFEAFWWVVVTISTVGYGDIVPHTELGQILAIIAIFGGIIAVSIVTAQMSAQLVTKKLFAKKGYLMTEDLENHLIICGFKTPRMEVLEQFKKRYDGRIVLIHTELSPEIEDLLTTHNLRFVQGNYNEEEILKKARVQKADKVMILNAHDQFSDAKVLETVIVIRSLSPNVYILAEIINPKYENYLIKSKCNEIIMSEEYNRFLLSKSVFEPGMSKVVRNLLRTQNFHIVKEHSFIGKTYKEAFDESLKRKDILLGVIENYVSGSELKRIILNNIHFGKEIDKYKGMLNKLKRNEIEMNVLINPADDYVIPEFAAIILMKR